MKLLAQIRGPATLQRMARDMLIHFEPFGGGNYVEAEVFVESLRGIVDGFKSMANALAPAISQHRSWSRSLVREALTLAVTSVERGSVDVGVVPGAVAGGPPLDTSHIADIGWLAMAAAMKGAARGMSVITDVPLSAAQGFKRGADVARKANVRVSLRSRRHSAAPTTPWRVNLDITGIEPALGRYIERTETRERAVTQLVGQIVAITFDPPTFVLATGKGKITVAMPAALRQKARDQWGTEVVALVDAWVTADGEVRNPKAVEISAATSGDNDDVPASLSAAFDSPEAREYFDSLRGRRH